MIISAKMDVMEKLCLQWNDFKENATSSFRELRADKDLTDVTLACEHGKQVEAHKIILAPQESCGFKPVLLGDPEKE